MNFYFFAIFAHLVGDYVFQTDFIAQTKGKYFLILLVHSLLWTFTVSIVLMYFSIYSNLAFAWLLVTHVGMDWWKAHRVPAGTDSMGWPLWLDQIFHIVTIYLVYWVTV